MKNKDFAVFILSHGRADNVKTYDTIIRAGYTGKIYILIDNEDKTADLYYKNFGDKVVMFDKQKVAKNVDTLDNFEGRKAIVYARNINFDIAQGLGLKYFLQLDDDYTAFWYRFNSNLEWEAKPVRDLDSAFNIVLDYLKNTDIDSIAFAQGGDLLGGSHSQLGKSITVKRKCMNTWFFKVKNPIKFIGKMNEDYTSSLYYGSLGKLFFTINQIAITQVATQQASGGMSDIYADNGTYVKTFYSVMVMPSFVKVSLMGESFRRLHHLTSWDNAVPLILNEKYKKY